MVRQRRAALISGLLLIIAALWNERAVAYLIELEGNTHWLDYDILAPALEIHPGKPETLHVYGSWSELESGGLIGAEFGIIGLPQGWAATPIQATSVQIMLGDPFMGRVNIAFGECQINSERQVLLMSVVLEASSEVADVFIQVVAGDPPTNPIFNFPYVNQCDESFTPAWTNPGSLVLNPRTVAIEYRSWGGIKVLYR